jgi:hypothetical protein
LVGSITTTAENRQQPSYGVHRLNRSGRGSLPPHGLLRAIRKLDGKLVTMFAPAKLDDGAGELVEPGTDCSRCSTEVADHPDRVARCEDMHNGLQFVGEKRFEL